MKLEMENKQMKIKKRKEINKRINWSLWIWAVGSDCKWALKKNKNKNEKELIWGWMKWVFKRKMGISYWVFELWAGLEWTGGKWIKWALEKERKTVAERVRKGGGDTLEKFISPKL